MADWLEAFERVGDAESIEVPQDVSDGEVVDERGCVVSVKSRRKLGRKLTIAWCVVEFCGRGDVFGGLVAGEEVDLVCSGEVLAKRFASKRPELGAWHAAESIVVERSRARSGRRVARCGRYAGRVARREEAAADDALALAPKRLRAVVFAAWLDEPFGRARLDSVLDVAGGRGDLSAALLRRGAARVATVIEPCARSSRAASHEDDGGGDDDDDDEVVEDDAFRSVSRVDDLFLYPRSSAPVERALEACTTLVALHPDEATEAAVCAAASRGLPFAVVPCCIFASKFKYRRQFWLFDPEARAKGVRTQNVYVEYLAQRAKALGCVDVRTAALPLAGRNVVLYSLGGAAASTAAPTPPTWPFEVVKHVATFLDVGGDLARGALRLDKHWLFSSNRALKDRVGEAAAELRRRAPAVGARVDHAPLCRADADDAGRRDARVAGLVGDALRLRDLASLKAELTSARWLPRRDATFLSLLGAIHGAVLGPAFLGTDPADPTRAALFVERAGLRVSFAAEDARPH